MTPSPSFFIGAVVTDNTFHIFISQDSCQSCKIRKNALQWLPQKTSLMQLRIKLNEKSPYISSI
jgi:hypothetical protein